MTLHERAEKCVKQIHFEVYFDDLVDNIEQALIEKIIECAEIAQQELEYGEHNGIREYCSAAKAIKRKILAFKEETDDTP